LIEAEAQFLKRNMLFAESELHQSPQGSSVELQSPLSVDAKGAEEAIHQMLYTFGFAVLTRDAGKGLYEVVFIPGQRGREGVASPQPLPYESTLARPHLQQPVTTVFPLQHANAAIAINALRPFFAQGGGPGGCSLTLGTAGTNNSLLLSGMQSQVADALLML